MSQVCSFFSKSVNPILFRAKLARKIENIQKEFNNVAEEMSKLNLNRSSVILKQDECGWRETSSSVLESEIIGREENKNYFQKKYQRWIKRNVAGIELLDLLLVWNTSDVITSLNLVGAPFQSLQYLPRKKKKFAVQARALSGFMPNPNPFAIGFSLHFKATNIILSKNG
ncbi:hypothetical protein Ahy_A10g046816 isoform C [Arachis hypogaea]|uniref:Uncharacterized protein n=1 Tax=Arachis hypogaea TaxID=3818 RepID=A0A445B0M9_ARAHY|nr:hypothetical protein Ahy_A10g046816 isoform C [Arachis hypogaea]